MHRELWIDAPHLFRSARTWGRPVYSQSSESNETAGCNQAPRVSECLEDETQGAQVLPCLLDRDNVEAGDDLGDAAKVEEVTPGRVALLRAPLRRQPAEGTKVPRGGEDVAVELPGRNDRVELAAQMSKAGDKSCGSGSTICGIVGRAGSSQLWLPPEQPSDHGAQKLAG